MGMRPSNGDSLAPMRRQLRLLHKQIRLLPLAWALPTPQVALAITSCSACHRRGLDRLHERACRRETPYASSCVAPSIPASPRRAEGCAVGFTAISRNASGRNIRHLPSRRASLQQAQRCIVPGLLRGNARDQARQAVTFSADRRLKGMAGPDLLFPNGSLHSPIAGFATSAGWRFMQARRQPCQHISDKPTACVGLRRHGKRPGLASPFAPPVAPQSSRYRPTTAYSWRSFLPRPSVPCRE